MSWVLVIWVLVNFALFAVLLGYAIRLTRKWRSTSLGFVATTLVLVAGTFLLASIQRIGLQFSRAEIIPPRMEDFFLIGYQVVLSLVGTVTGIYAVTRLRAGMRRLEEGERMLTTLTGNVPLDVEVTHWRLTDRESQVLATIVAGKTSDEQIAQELFISTHTAATHVRNILRKAGLSSRIDLMLVGGRKASPGSETNDVPDIG